MRFAYLFLVTTLPVAAQEYTVKALARHSLTNESIVALAQAGFDELFIIERIRTSRTNFNTNVEDLVALKKAGITEDLIRVMLMPGPSSGVLQTATPAPVEEVSPPGQLIPDQPKPVEPKWWTYPWVRVRGLICRQ